MFAGVTFADGDTLGARALANGTVNVYKNGVQIGTTNVSAFFTATTAGSASGSPAPG